MQSLRSLHTQIKRADLFRTQGFIGGHWVEAHSKEYFVVTDPSTLAEVARVSNMGKVETIDAINAATDAFASWRHTSSHTRSILLKKWFDAVRAHTDDLAMITSFECGKPLAEAKGEVAYAAGFIDYYAHECMNSSGFMVPSTLKGQHMMAMKEPVGVCGVITPWNFPLAMITRKLGPCLAAGCTAVVKPAAETPLSALALAKLAQEVGIPAGVINVVPAPHEKAAEVGETLATNNLVRKLSFTGSTRVGKLLMAQSSANVKRLSLELGGNAPFIVFEDADIDAAIEGLMQSKFRNAGQTCVGNPRDHSTQIGPLISDTAVEKISSIVDDARKKGADILFGGKKSTVGHQYYEPTVLTNLTSNMRVAKEEIFGPVAPLFIFDTEEDVISQANNTDVGLAGYFYTKDLGRAWRVAGELQCGMIGVNTGMVSNVQAPFGGIKQSGLGREGSPLGMEEYLESKLVVMAGLEQ